MDAMVVRLICAAGAVLFLTVIVLRRRKQAD